MRTLGKVFSAPLRVHASRTMSRMEQFPPEKEMNKLFAERDARTRFSSSLRDLLAFFSIYQLQN